MSILTIIFIVDFLLFAIGCVIAGIKGLNAIQWAILFMLTNVIAIPLVILNDN